MRILVPIFAIFLSLSSHAFATQEASDPNMWMEESSPRRDAWVKSQNEEAERRLSNPESKAAEKRILKYSDYVSSRSLHPVDGGWLVLQSWAGTPRSSLAFRDANGVDRHLAGEKLDSKTATDGWTVQSFDAAPDGKAVLVHLTPKDSRWAKFQLIDIASGKVTLELEGDVHSYSSTSWAPDSSSFAVSFFEKDGDAPTRSRLEIVNAKTGARVPIFGPIAGSKVKSKLLYPYFAADSGTLFVEAQEGGESELYVLSADYKSARKLSSGSGAWRFLGSRGGRLWAYTNDGAPNGRFVRFDRLDGGTAPVTIIPEGRGSIAAGSTVGGNAYGMFGNRIIYKYDEDAAPSIVIADEDGKQIARSAIPPSGSTWGGFSGHPLTPTAYYDILGLSEPATSYSIDLNNGRQSLLSTTKLPFGPDQFVAYRTFVPGPDGARIPLLVAHRKGLAMDRPHPLILYGYGAFGWVGFLWYQPQVIDWLLEDDGIFAVAGIRGGGEFGESWHQAGMARNRQTAINDYVAVSKYLIDQKLTSSKLLVANGTSLAASTVGAAVNQHPELYGAVWLDYPLLDLMRYPHFLSAQYFVPELGSPDDPDDAAVLRRLSPLHNLRSDVCYPPILVRPGEHDASVTPIHAYKYAAAFQATTKCKSPLVLDVMEGAGHNYGETPAAAARNHALGLEFLRQSLGLRH